MLRQLAVNIPQEQWPNFMVFLTESIENLQTLVNFLSTTDPLPDVEDLVDLSIKVIEAKEDVAEAVVTIALNLSHIRRLHDLPSSDILNDVAEALERGGFPEWNEIYSSIWKERQYLIKQLLHIDNTVDIMAKARELMYDFQSIFLESAVLTDVRYVYNSSATEVKGGLILHTLSLEYFDGRRREQSHIMLSPSDVKKLKLQLERAERKFDSTAAMLQREQIPELTPKRNI